MIAYSLSNNGIEIKWHYTISHACLTKLCHSCQIFKSIFKDTWLNAPGPGTDIHTAMVKEYYNHTIHGYNHITICHLLAMVPLSIDVHSKVMSDTVRNAEHQSMHRTAAPHFVEYLETPPSTKGIPSLASLLQVYRYSTKLGHLSALQHMVSH